MGALASKLPGTRYERLGQRIKDNLRERCYRTGIQNIVGKCSQEWPHGKLSPSNEPGALCGAARADRHHEDYDKPLEIRWICRSWVNTFSITETNSEAGAKGLAGSRLFYSAKATSADRADSRHPTVKPIDLLRWMVRLVTPKGGTILDPFAGSGTTGEAAMLEGFDAILIEREAEHAADIAHRQRRLASAATLLLFAEAADLDVAETAASWMRANLGLAVTLMALAGTIIGGIVAGSAWIASVHHLERRVDVLRAGR